MGYYVCGGPNGLVFVYMAEFKLQTSYKPAGDQPSAIKGLVKGLEADYKYQTLLGVTGSGKTFSMAKVIEQTQRPALIIAHNKTLAAQLCNEFREFFPDAAVEYFVSYYDYYQPEAYIVRNDTYIEKDAQVNDEIDRLRHATTQSLLSRRDVIVVASVSCIYNVGSPENYEQETIHIEKGQPLNRTQLMRRLVELQFTRTTADLKRGMFRSHGPIFEVSPVQEEVTYRIEMTARHPRIKSGAGSERSEGSRQGGSIVDRILMIDPVTRKLISETNDVWLFPAKHHVSNAEGRHAAIKTIKAELEDRLKYFNKHNMLLEAERLERRTRYDLEMIEQLGFCSGIENYSRHFDGRAPGERPNSLIEFFPEDFLTFIDESHVTVPQIGAMHNGDRARKTNLIDNGFRLPSAYDNRPLRFDEFETRVGQTIMVSATPGPYEYKHSEQIVEQIVRPTGLLDPKIDIRPVTGDLSLRAAKTAKQSRGSGKEAAGSRRSARDDKRSQVEDLIDEVVKRAKKDERVLVTTLTKKMAEDLSEYLEEQGVKAKYIHSDIKTLERIQILTEFRRGKFDCLVGVNLLREGLDLPEVTLVAILDADKEGFLRSETSLVQTIGRAARNAAGEVILYADNITGSMKRAIAETDRRRKKQLAYNKKHGITPQTIKKAIKDITKIWGIGETDVKETLKLEMKYAPDDLEKIIKQKEKQMREAAKNLEFEMAALLRDEIKLLRKEIKK